MVESLIDGEFEGFESDRIYVLRNGQVGQQTSYEYKYRYRYAPHVTISRSGGGRVMVIEGMSRTVYVAQVEAIQSRINGDSTGWIMGGHTHYRTVRFDDRRNSTPGITTGTLPL